MTNKYVKVKIYNLDAGAQAWDTSTSIPSRPTGNKRPGGRGGKNIKGEAPPLQVNNYYYVTEDLESIKNGEYIFIMRAGENYQLIRMMNDNGTIKIVEQVVPSTFLTNLIPKLKLVIKDKLLQLRKDFYYTTKNTLNVNDTIINAGTRLKINGIIKPDKGPTLYNIELLDQVDKSGLSTNVLIEKVPLDNFRFYLTSSAPKKSTDITYATGKSYLYCGGLKRFEILDNIKSLPCIITLGKQLGYQTNNPKPTFNLIIKYVSTDGNIKTENKNMFDMMSIIKFVTELTPKLKESVTALFQ